MIGEGIVRINGDRTIEKVDWPDGAQSAVNIAFEVDLNVAKDLMGDCQAEWTQGEFGARVGIWRVLNLLRHHDVRATFFTPLRSAELYPEIVEAITRDGHEVASHTVFHDDVSEMKRTVEKDVLKRSKEALAILSKQVPVGWRKAVGEMSDNTLDLLIDEGFTYIANGMADDIPFWWKTNSGRDILAIPFIWMFDDALYFAFYPGRGTGIQRPAKLFEIWNAEFEASYELGRLFSFTCHPFLIGRLHRLAWLDRFLTIVTTRPRVWIATCKEIAQWWIERYPVDSR